MGISYPLKMILAVREMEFFYNFFIPLGFFIPKSVSQKTYDFFYYYDVNPVFLRNASSALILTILAIIVHQVFKYLATRKYIPSTKTTQTLQKYCTLKLNYMFRWNHLL